MQFQHSTLFELAVADAIASSFTKAQLSQAASVSVI